MSVTITPNMNLAVPVVGSEPGPQWATDINNCLTLIDEHNHSAGSGVQINPNGLDMNDDLPMNDNNIISIRSLRLQPQASPLALITDLNCLYDSGVDLYFNDGLGNQVRITQGGAVAGTPGSIANLVPPASAAYVSGNQTFVFQSGANTPGNIDGGSFIFRNILANSKGLTLSPPSAMAADYSIVLPSLPVVQSFMTLDASGNMAAPWTVDNSTLAISSNQVIVKNYGITQIKRAIRAQTTDGSDPGVGGVAISASCGNFNTSSGSLVDVTNLECEITTLGNPVKIAIISDGDATNSSVFGASGQPELVILRDSTVIHKSSAFSDVFVPTTSINQVDFPAAGTYTYKVQLRLASGGGPAIFVYSKLVVYED